MPASTKQGAEALRRLHADLSAFCGDISDEEWHAPSRAESWRIHDCVAHIGGSAKALFTPTSVRLLASSAIERTNDVLVDSRRTWERARVMRELNTWCPRVAALAGGVNRTPLGGLRVPLAELGRFPFGAILSAALTFDQHTHLHFDMAPALDREAPATDELRMGLVLLWMTAVLGNQLAKATPTWLDRPVALTLDGPGGDTWRIEPGGTVRPGSPSGAAAHITGRTVDFPSWGTGRTPATDADLAIGGDEALAEAFLGSLNIV
jgi:hypothetical protein